MGCRAEADDGDLSQRTGAEIDPARGVGESHRLRLGFGA